MELTYSKSFMRVFIAKEGIYLLQRAFLVCQKIYSSSVIKKAGFWYIDHLYLSAFKEILSAPPQKILCGMVKSFLNFKCKNIDIISYINIY